MDSNNCIVRFDDSQESSQSGEPLTKVEESRPLFSVPNAVAILFLFFNMLLNFAVLAIIHERVPRFATFNSTTAATTVVPYPPLPDISADYLPEARWALFAAEYIIIAQGTIVILLLVFHKSRVTIVRRVCVIYGLLYFYRAICMISTQVPLLKSDYCEERMAEEVRAHWASYLTEITRRVVTMMQGLGLSVYGKHKYCGDYIYSGHTVTLTFIYLTLEEYLIPKNARCRPIVWSIFKAIALFSSIVGVIFILLARGHYTVDVLLAYYVTTRIFFMYHTLIYNKSLRYKNPKNYLSRLWWWHLMKYLEYEHTSCSISARNNGVCLRCDATNTEVPRKFDWPFTWTKSSGKRSTSLQRLLSQTPQV